MNSVMRSMVPAVLLTVITASHLLAQQPWVQRQSGTDADLSDVVWTGSCLVAVGTGGTILTSPDGVRWIERQSGTHRPLRGVAWTGSTFVAVGGSMFTGAPMNDWDTGVVVTSSDGVNWRDVTPGRHHLLSDVAWTGGQFVAVGWFGTVFTSPDGINWTERPTGVSRAWGVPGGNNALQAVAWDGAALVAVGSTTVGTGVVLTSPDGIQWTPRTPATVTPLSGVAYAGSRVVAVGSSTRSGTAFSSADGIEWVEEACGVVSLSCVAWDGATVVAAGIFGDIVTMRDGVWQRQSSGVATRLDGATAAGSQFVVVGQGGVILTAQTTTGALPPMRSRPCLAGPLAVSVDAQRIGGCISCVVTGAGASLAALRLESLRGQLVSTATADREATGRQTFSIPVYGVAAGQYLLTVTSGSSQIRRPVAVR
jgi:hypothetical protein